jgi:hypothetical protein
MESVWREFLIDFCGFFFEILNHSFFRHHLLLSSMAINFSAKERECEVFANFCGCSQAAYMGDCL